ncbi:hypothetical protein [Pantoea vagans]|nr:hypothetical protein ACJ3_16720 [Pantoea sp. QMID3]
MPKKWSLSGHLSTYAKKVDLTAAEKHKALGTGSEEESVPRHEQKRRERF